MIITYRDTPIYFTSEGTGNPMVLLHGFLETSEIWKNFVPDLAKNRQVICVDLPGHGKSGCFGEVHTMTHMAQAVKAVLDQLEVKQVAIAGHSMGGYVSLEFAKNYPEMVKSISLINSTPEADDEERRIYRDRATNLVIKNKKAFVNMAINNLVVTSIDDTFKTEIELLKRSAEELSKQGIIAALQGMKIRTNNIDFLTSFGGDKYIVAGEKDPVVDYLRIREIAKKCETSLKSFNGGHLAFIENKIALQKFMHFIE